jgi:hypothetical protein
MVGQVTANKANYGALFFKFSSQSQAADLTGCVGAKGDSLINANIRLKRFKKLQLLWVCAVLQRSTCLFAPHRRSHGLTLLQ